MAQTIREGLLHVKFGALRFWGSVFGSLHDNQHILRSVDAKDGSLRLVFHHDEESPISRPHGPISYPAIEILGVLKANRHHFPMRGGPAVRVLRLCKPSRAVMYKVF